jgi:small subunit ribosomal protein S4
MALLRTRTGDYKTRLLEKQRLRAQYNVGESQLRRAVTEAARARARPARRWSVI